MGNDWFTCLGRRPPEEARAAAMRLLENFADEFPDGVIAEASTEDLYDHIQTVAKYIEQDKPYEAMDEAQRYLDLMGSYRLLAALCVGHLERGEVLGEDREPHPNERLVRVR